MKKLACSFFVLVIFGVTAVALAAGVNLTSIPGYDILEYIQSSGTQYIDTGIVYASDTKLEQRFCFSGTPGKMEQMGRLILYLAYTTVSIGVSLMVLPSGI